MLADHRVKVKDEKLDRYLDLARELKKLWNIKVMVIPIIVGVLETVLKNMEKKLDELEIRGRIKTIQTTAGLKSARTLRRKWRRLAVTQTTVKNQQLELVWKTQINRQNTRKRKEKWLEDQENHSGGCWRYTLSPTRVVIVVVIIMKKDRVRTGVIVSDEIQVLQQ